MASWTKTELKRANKEKKRCKKMYKDWVDNEFNCGPNKFIFGVISDDNKYMLEASQTGIASFQTLNNLQIYYNRDTQKYLLDIDCYGCDMDVGINSYLSNLLKQVKDFIETHENSLKINYLIEDSIFPYLEDMSNYWQADDLVTLYGKLYIFVNGYKQLCRNKKNLEVL